MKPRKATYKLKEGESVEIGRKSPGSNRLADSVEVELSKRRPGLGEQTEIVFHLPDGIVAQKGKKVRDGEKEN